MNLCNVYKFAGPKQSGTKCGHASRSTLHFGGKDGLLHHRLPTNIISRVDRLFLLRLHKRKASVLLLESHRSKANHDQNPVQVVRKDRAVRRRVRPPKYRVEDAPAAASVDFWRAAVDVPDALADVVGSWTGACLAGVASDGVVPGVVFEVPDCAGEEAGCYEVEEAGADYEEDLEFCCVATTGGMSAIDLSAMEHEAYR